MVSLLYSEATESFYLISVCEYCRHQEHSHRKICQKLVLPQEKRTKCYDFYAYTYQNWLKRLLLEITIFEIVLLIIILCLQNLCTMNNWVTVFPWTTFTQICQFFHISVTFRNSDLNAKHHTCYEYLFLPESAQYTQYTVY